MVNLLKEKFIRKFCIFTWRFWELFGLHVVPNHFYWPIQDSKKLDNYNFKSEFPKDGIKMNMDKNLELLSCLEKYASEYQPLYRESGYTSNGDGAILYSMIRNYCPKKIIEVGSGYSTNVINEALEINYQEKKIEGNIISIEPYPKKYLRDLVSKKRTIELIEDNVENVDKSIFKQLDSGDILFIDSSHVINIANDVHFLYLKILPILPVGVIVHIHDIRFPYEYPYEWVMKAKKHWTEQYLLQMFLCFNDSYEILFASNYVFQNNRKKMSNMLVGLEEDGDGWPGSFWIRRIK